MELTSPGAGRGTPGRRRGAATDIPSRSQLFVIGAATGLGALLSTLGLIAADPDEDFPVWIYAVGLALAVVAALLLVSAAERRQRALFRIEENTSRLARVTAQLRERGEKLRADDPLLSTGQRMLSQADADYETLVQAGAYRQAASLAAAKQDLSYLVARRKQRRST